MSDVLKIAHVAERLDCSPAKVRQLIAVGKLRAVDLGCAGRHDYRITSDALDAFLGTPSPPPAPAPSLERSPTLVSRRFLGGNR